MEVAAEVDSPAIKPINKGVVHRICAGQVILDLSSAVKELVENSLDAGATTIEIVLKDYGEDFFQVIDNGCGISPSNFKVLALKHHTSKLADFPDLQFIATFGFRGEALSSLCSLGNLTVETRTKNESVATHLTFDHSGHLVDKRKTARQIGTTVTVKKLFSNLPVRSKEFSRSIRKEYGKLTSLLNAYAVIARGVRLVCTNTTGRNARSVVLKTQGSHSLKDNIITVFGMSTFTCLEPLSIDLTESCKVEGYLSKSGNGSGRNSGDRQFFFVNGRPVDMPKVSKLVNELYRGANSRQFPIAIMNFTIPGTACDVNVTPDKRKIYFSEEGLVLRSLKEGLEKIYSPGSVSLNVNKLDDADTEQANSSHLPGRLSNSSKKPCLHRVQAEEKSSHLERKFDDTLSEIIENGHKQLDTAKSSHDGSEKSLGTDFFLKPNAMKEYSHSDCSNVEPKLGSETEKKELEKDKSVSLLCPRSIQSSFTKFLSTKKRKPENISSALSEVPILRNGILHSESQSNQPEMFHAASKSSIKYHIGDCHPKTNEDIVLKRLKTEDDYCRRQTSLVLGGTTGIELSTGSLEEDKMNLANASRGDMVHVSDVQNAICQSQNTRATHSATLEHGLEDISDVSVTDTPLASTLKPCSTLQFTIQDLLTRRLKRMPRLLSNSNNRRMLVKSKCYTAATVDLLQEESDEQKTRALDAATTELDRLFQKKDFSNMKVVGQFNLGFIIGKLDQDLFIVDQHAADEKYNYERLSQSTIMNQQPLLMSQTLELSPEEEVVASMHIDIIRKNGFSLEEDINAVPGQRFMLTAVPFSKNIVFGVEDVKELISTLSDGHGECSLMSYYKINTANSICPSRVRAMLASRACRSSVMVGDALGRNEMKKILEHLAELNSPWNCPHGRPTMRHLHDLSTIHENLKARTN
ncbi:hypothetical protein V2J09_021259 [Rumex salicifolius]